MNNRQKEFYQKFGQLVKKARIHHDIDQKSLAEKLKITQAKVSHIENAQSDIAFTLAIDLVYALNFEPLTEFVHKIWKIK